MALLSKIIGYDNAKQFEGDNSFDYMTNDNQDVVEHNIYWVIRVS